MNANLPGRTAEVQPAPLLRELLAAEPELARLMPAKELDALVRGYLRQLRLAAELERRVES